MVSRHLSFFGLALQLTFLVTVASGLMSCGKSTMGRGSEPAVPEGPGGGGPPDELTRSCRIPVRYDDPAAHTAALEALVQANVRNKERPTTVCIGATATPLTRFNASFRTEYEDDYGLRWVTLRQASLVYSKQNAGQFRLIYLDRYGYVDVKTTLGTGETYSGNIRVANVSQYESYLSQIDAFLNLIRTTCSQSPVQCMNPIFVTDPLASMPPTDAQIIQRAEEAFQGLHGAESFTLGTISFDQSLIERTLF
jgi:hypothetical protein